MKQRYVNFGNMIRSLAVALRIIRRSRLRFSRLEFISSFWMSIPSMEASTRWKKCGLSWGGHSRRLTNRKRHQVAYISFTRVLSLAPFRQVSWELALTYVPITATSWERVPRPRMVYIHAPYGHLFRPPIGSSSSRRAIRLPKSAYRLLLKSEPGPWTGTQLYEARMGSWHPSPSQLEASGITLPMQPPAGLRILVSPKRTR